MSFNNESVSEMQCEVVCMLKDAVLAGGMAVLSELRVSRMGSGLEAKRCLVLYKV